MNPNMPQSVLPRTLTLPARPPMAHTGMSSHDILRGQKTIEINHNGSTYKLQATRLGKLILTK